MIFSAFSQKDIQNFINIATIAESEGIIDLRFLRQRLQEFLSESTREMVPKYSEKRAIRKIFTPPKCPKCGSPLFIYKINISANSVVDDGSNFVIQCSNAPVKDAPWEPTHCGYVEYKVTL